MALPVIMWGNEGEQFATYTDKRYAIGQKMVFLDGRTFRFCLNGATAGVAGDLADSPATTANHVNLAVQAATAVNATSIPVTIGATTVTANQYANGYITIDVTPGQGYTYKIGATHPQVTVSSTTFSVPLAGGDGVQVALTTSSKASLTVQPYANVVPHVASALGNVTGVTVGVYCSAVAAASYGWLQTFGECNILTSGVVVAGMGVSPSVLVTGAIDAWSCASSVQLPIIGQVVRVGATTAQSVVFIRLDG